MGRCDGRVAFVTGASRGIGKAIAMRLASEGASVVLNSPIMGEEAGLPGTLDSAVADIQAMGGKAAAIACDLADPEARAGLIERASEFFGPVDILVNNAGAGIMKPLIKIEHGELTFMFELNVIAPVDLARQCLPEMKKAGAGWVLNIGSGSARIDELPGRNGISKEATLSMGGYGTTKAALDRATLALSREVQEYGIFVNSMRPTAIVLTPGADFTRMIAKTNPDMLEPVEMMAEAALELCTGRHVGRVIASREIIYYVGGKVHSLDGKTVLGDAFLLGDPGSSAG
ncbi:7-alpha-hydroxysteroid dehydrogenase [Ruegeria denitrificans]|uniref:7-alpha-hydroxysteroid dehydrogenase n=1 Tax=Ruegeria denitrificans TaxID=1715692 RepID=A0A0N7M840_9RHOB|nr:7-alpha-hydroxysteroid dehydrogenase [Ruegeria denitrificans]